jgi:hypothetical protein
LKAGTSNPGFLLGPLRWVKGFRVQRFRVKDKEDIKEPKSLLYKDICEE